MEIRDRILAAAARVYEEVGFRGTTTRRVAIEAGVNEITLFRHFGSKSALLCEAIAKAGGAMVANTLPAEPGDDPAAEIVGWARAHMSELVRSRALLRTVMGEVQEHPEMVPPCGSPAALAARSVAVYISRLQERGLARTDVDPVLAAAMILGALFADAVGRDVMPDMFPNDPDTAAAEYARLLIRAIGAEVPVA
jgi:AcrR family transcriptional regulator